MADHSGQGKAALAALTGASLIGLAPIAIRLSEVGPNATNLWRFLFALPILAVWAGMSRPIPSQRQTLWLVLGGLLFGLEISLWAIALNLTTVTNATLLVNLTPVFAALFGWIWLKERLSTPILAGGAVALAGAVTLALARAQTGGGPAEAPEHGWIGDSISLLGALFYAGYLMIVRALGKNVSVGAVMFWATLAAACVAAVISFAMGETTLPQTWVGWAIVIGLGLFVQVGGQGLIAYGVGRLPIVVSTVLLWMQPLVAAALSWALFDEALSAVALFGAALVLTGIYVVQRSRQ
ncbi:DMT family transporter [Terricaulis silvestris]|uniref:Carboxylate/amino acid/amine transporter n=1 Tax=Terricaulis silvestris TaxID=2686094 RepID=A0A6I6MKB0_9CAUL|nr:DMT family transporter [Terricaulis silvestris]QGZ94391.1 carboxylate/amino acid/amine transporter [Terricaulis silvestris]